MWKEQNSVFLVMCNVRHKAAYTQNSLVTLNFTKNRKQIEKCPTKTRIKEILRIMPFPRFTWYFTHVWKTVQK